MTNYTSLFWWKKQSGRLAGVLFILATLATVDSLIGGLSGLRRPIGLIPGSNFDISGPLPPKTETIEDLIIDGQPEDGSVRLIPAAIFSGYWFGGSMWRGTVTVAPDAPEGQHIIQVKDPFGEKQNPALVFTIKIWPDQKTLNAHAPSLLARLTGLRPFIFALSLIMCGIVIGAIHFLLSRHWSRLLAQQSCSEIYKLLQTPQGTEFSCDLPPQVEVTVGMQCPVYRPPGGMVYPTGVIVALENRDIVLRIVEENSVRLGDVVCLRSPADETLLPD